MSEAGIEALLLSVGADLPWLSGYEAMPLERLTMLVLPADADAVLVVPALEAPRVELDPSLFALRPWSEWEDPVSIVAELVGRRRRLGVSDRTWATFLLALQLALPDASWSASSSVTGRIRAVKDSAEIEALAAVAAAADRVGAQLLAGEISLIGHTERDVSGEISRRLLAEGHSRVNFAIVGSGPNSASPHHEAGERRIGTGDAVVCDFGGTMAGYCSDITRTVFTGPPSAEAAEVYAIVREAQSSALAAAGVGVPCEQVDAVARRIITAGGYGEQFIHRTGHGIGVEEHEIPYLVRGNQQALEEGNAFSVEPGIYLSGRFGVRIEDIVVATSGGPRPLNSLDHGLAVVEA